MRNDMSNRRSFLKTSAAALAGSTVIPWDALALAKSRIGANDKINAAAIGINGMGWTDFTNLIQIPDVNPVAICDVDENVLNKRMGELNTLGIKVKTFTDYRKMLESKDIDVVVIGTPDHWHCLQMVEACQAGKDVYVEKPVGNSIQECGLMTRAQQQTERVVQVGQWQRSVKHFSDALAFVHSGQLGKIRLVKAWAYQGWMTNIEKKPDGEAPKGVHYDMWLGPATKRPFNPNRFHFNFRWFWDYAGGLMTDWGVHLIDYALMGMKARLPNTIMASGGKMAYPDGAHETPDTLTTIFEFNGFQLLWEQAQSISNGNYGLDHGVAFIGNNGTLVLSRGGWQVIPDEKRMEAVPLRNSLANGVAAHAQNFIDVVKSRKMENLACSIADGAHVAQVCQMGNIAYRTAAKLSWNADAMKFHDATANSLMEATYHNGYQVPKLS